MRNPWIALWLLVSAGTAGCTCATDLDGTGPCSGADRLPGCGRACTTTSECEVGTRCGVGGTCTAECSVAWPCSGGRRCSTEGLCVGDGSDAGIDAARPDAAPPDALPFDSQLPDRTCASVRLETTRITPNVLLVIDQSGSMLQLFGGPDTRWEVLQESLIGTPDGIVTRLAPTVRFGVMMYTDDGGTKDPTCPELATLPAMIANFSGISSFYSGRGPGGNTPTGDALASALADLDRLVPMRADPTFIVLATDGEPGTCEASGDPMAGRNLVLEQVSAAHAMGIETYVLSVGSEVGADHLQDVANAGVGAAPSDPDAPFWIATEPSGLRDALGTIITGVISCEVELEGRIDPSLACEGDVTLGTDELECDVDWRAIDETHIEVLGEACERLQSEPDLVLFGIFPCDVILI